ncbi:MAG: ABC transporter permease [Lysobacterales bacterium]
MNDLRYALRYLTRQFGFTLIVALTLGLGIGLVTTQYSLVDGILLRPLPFADADRLLHLGRSGAGNGLNWQPLTPREFMALRDGQQSFEELAAFNFDFYNLSQSGAAPRRLTGRAVSSSFFPALRTRPALGHAFGPADEHKGQELKVLLADVIWREEFGADPAVLGRQVKLNGQMATIVGVMPPGFRFPVGEDVWVNLRLPADLDEAAADQQLLNVEVLGLLKPGISTAQAQAEGQTLLQRLPPLAADANAGREPTRLVLQPFQSAYNDQGTVTLLGIMLAMTLIVLVLACINTANLLYVHASDRLRELAVRSALGADRARLVRQLLLESVLLAGLGAGIGLLIASVGVHLLQTEISARVSLSSWIVFDLNWRVLAFTSVIAVLSGLAAGLVPALRLAALNLNSTLRADGRGSVGGERAWAARSVVIGQLGFACAAMILASLLALSALRSSRGTLPFDPDTLLIGRVELQGLPYGEARQRSDFYQQLLNRIQQVPGVTAAAVSSRDLVNPGVYSQFEIAGREADRPQDRPGAFLEVISRDYFQVIDRKAISGRVFGDEDGIDSAPVALVNQSLAERFWPGRSPIGERLRRDEDGAPWATVVGMVPDLNIEGIGNRAPAAGWYLLQDQTGWGWLDLLVRVQGNPDTMITPVREAVAAIDPDQPIHTITTLRERTRIGLTGLQIIGSMAAIFALAALILVAVGVYGVMSFAARRRTREVGLRMALGASPGSVTAMLVRRNLGRTLLGIGSGLILGYALALPLQPVLPAVSIFEPWLYLAVGTTLASAALLASWLPAWRASTRDPLDSLRAE